MLCISPITLKAKNAIIRRTQQVPCGKCIPCLEKKRNDWSVRIQEQMNKSETSRFLTLTYNPGNLPYSEETGSPTLEKSHLQLFLKQLRNYLKQGISTTNHFGKSVKTPKIDVKLVYFAQGEYGAQKNRPHYHMILFNFPNYLDYLIEKAWYHGFVYFGECNYATVHYTTKYLITKYDADFEGIQKPFALMSKGIGKSYIQRNSDYHAKNLVSTITQIGGAKYPIPRYFKEKIFNDEQKMKVSAQNQSWAKRKAELDDFKLRKSVKSDSEFFITKQLRTEAYLQSRELMFNKSKKL